MQKYFNIFKITLRNVLAYKSTNLLFLLISLLNLGLGMLVWTVAFKNPTFRSPHFFSLFISYYFGVLLLSQLVNSYTFGDVSERHIKQGELSNFLLKPISYFALVFLSELPWRLISFVFNLPLVLIMFFSFKQYLMFNVPILLFVILFFWVFNILAFLIQIGAAFLTFWIEDNKGIESVLEVVLLIFSGFGIPLFFFPEYLQQINQFLPFQYTLYFPVASIIGLLNFTEIIRGCLIIALWYVTLVLLTKTLWNKGLKRYTSEGI